MSTSTQTVNVPSTPHRGVPRLHYLEMAYLADKFPGAGANLAAALRLISRIRELETVQSTTWHFSGDYSPLTVEEVSDIVRNARASQNHPWAT